MRFGEEAVVIPDAELDPDNEPLLHVQPDLPDFLPVGEATVLPLSLVGDGGEIRARSLPEGMVLEDRSLSWTPRADQVGPAIVELSLEGVGFTRT